MFRPTKLKFMFLFSIFLQTMFFSTAQAQTTTWTSCANEGGTCSFSGTRVVRYGAGTTWVSKTFTGSTACTNAVFGDPVYGTAKTCQYSSVDQAPAPTPTPTVTWTTCAQEWGTCSFTGTKNVRYGAGTKWVTKSITTSTPCTNAVFGDPIIGTTKSCQYSSDVVTGPTPTPTPTPTRRTLTVCSSGCSYTTPSQAIAASLDNDIIEVAAGSYNDCFSVSRNNILIRGMNGRAHLTGAMCGGKGAIVTSGNNTVVENFEFSNMYVTDRNGAGIRHQGLGLVVRNSYFHDGENGILSGRGTVADPADVITVENSRFEHLGGNGGQAHAVYFGASAQVSVKNSIFVASKEYGHEFKSRARNTSIECSYMGGTDGADSYSLNFPDGGVVSLKDSVVEQGPYSVNSNIIDYGSEMVTQHPTNTFNVNGATVINDLDRGAFFLVRNSTQFAVNNSRIVGPGTMFGSQAGTESGNTKFASRSAAGMSAYPAFPRPAACTGTIGLLN